jgi:hypothetical protein
MINRIYLWLISVAGVLSAIAVIFMSGKRKGKSELEAKQNENTLKQIEDTQRIIHDVGRISSDERSSLRKKWTRKK